MPAPKLSFELFKEAFQEWSDDKAPRLGAALAYYTIFSIAPLILIALAIAGAVFDEAAVRGEIFGQLRGLFGEGGAKALEEMIQNANKHESAGVWASILGGVILLFGAAGVFIQLKDALNTVWNVEPQKSGGIAGFIKNRLLSFGMVLGIGFLLMVSLVLTTIVSAMGKFMESRMPGGEPLWQVIQFGTEVALFTLLFAMLFKFLPDVELTWRDVWLGATFTSLLFVLGKFALGLYLGKGTVGSAYGAAGSLVVLLLWIYYSAQILFFGAEFTQVWVRHIGGDSPAAVRAIAKKQKRLPPPPEEHPAAAKEAPAARVPVSKGHGLLIGVGSGCAGILVGLLLGIGSLVKLAVGGFRKIFS